jgi:DNA-binding transcriptional LysR family regulator
MDELSRLHTFVRVVDAGSMSAAARSLRLSVPAVSRQISALEADLGAALLVRTTRRLHLTEGGRRFHERSLRILRELDAAREDMRSNEAVCGRLVVSASMTFAMNLVVPCLPALAKRHPALDIDLRLEDRVVDLLSEGVDVAIRGGLEPPNSDAVIAQPLLSFPRCAVASPRYLRRRGRPRTPADLARHDCLVQLGAAGPIDRWRFVRGREGPPANVGETRTAAGGEAVEVEVRGRLRLSAPLALRDLALAHLGIAWLPEWLVQRELADGRLERVLADWPSALVPTWALYRTELRRAPRVHAFIAALRAPADTTPASTAPAPSADAPTTAKAPRD